MNEREIFINLINSIDDDTVHYLLQHAESFINYYSEKQTNEQSEEYAVSVPA